MSPARVKSARIALGPEYVLRCIYCHPGVAAVHDVSGMYYCGRDEGRTMWAAGTSKMVMRMRGGGWHSASCALAKLGYYVERVPV